MADFDKVISPGQEGKIELVIEGKKVHGAFSKSATVTSNDPENPTMTIAIAGHELSYVDVKPADRVYLTGTYGEHIEKSVTIKSNEEGLDFKIVNVSSNIDDKITYKVVPGVTPGEFEIKMWKNPKLPTLNTYGSLYIKTNSEKAPEKTLQVQVVTKGAIAVQPQTVNYGRIKFATDAAPGSSVTKSVTVLKQKGEFVIEDVTVSNDMFKATFEEIVPGKRFKVDVTFEPPLKKQARHSEFGELIIHTNDPNEPTLQVRLVARAL